MMPEYPLPRHKKPIKSHQSHQCRPGPDGSEVIASVWSARRRRKNAEGLSAEFIGASAIHAYALSAADADYLQADVVSAVFVIGNGHQSPGRRVQVGAVG